MKPRDLKAQLDELEQDVDERRYSPKVLAERLETVASQLTADSEDWARTHRLKGVLQNRLKLDRSALRELREGHAKAAKALNYAELAKIGRETAVVHSWRGDDRKAALELLPALAYACLLRDEHQMAKIIAEFGRLELEARRFDSGAMLLRLFAGGATQPPPLPLPQCELHRMIISLCQAFNRVGAHDEARQRADALFKVLPPEEMRLRFLSRLEVVRACAGLKEFEAAEAALAEAKTLIGNEKETAYEHTEYLQAQTELEDAKGALPAVEHLEKLIAEYSKQQLTVQEVRERRTLANLLFKRGSAEEARRALAAGLQRALEWGQEQLADEIRADMLKFAGSENLEDLVRAIDVLGGGDQVSRRFVILNRLGRGGHGVVYRAVDLQSGRHVALKVIDVRAHGEEQRRALIMTIKTEYAAAQALDDPQVCRIRDILMVPEGPIYIVQDFVEGPTLRALYRDMEEPAHLLDLLAKIADALRRIHAKNIVHRDLKPENVIVATGENPVLIDFGIALVIGQPDEHRRLGTEPYEAPEQKEGKAVDRRADIYALGQMIAEIWGGKVPPPCGLFDFRKDDGGMPPSISLTVRKMIKRNPDRRHCDLEDIAKRLRGQQTKMVAREA